MSREDQFFAPTIEKKQAVDIKNGKILIGGLELIKDRERKERVPDAEKFKDFSLDNYSFDLLLRIAKSVELDQPLLLEGEAATGKSYTIEYLANLLNREVYRMSLNGQTDVTDLIGKWVPKTETVRKKIEDLLKDPAKCASKEAKKLIENKTRIIAVSAKKEEINPEKEKPQIGLTKEEMETIATLENIEVPEGDWVWQDGDLPRQMKSGAWSVLDEVNTCEPQILVRLNAALERGGQLVLQEDGSKVVNRHKNFRLFATVNPPGGRYKGRVPLSAEWISRWNYQNLDKLPKEVRAKRLMAAEGVKIEEYNLPGEEYLSPQKIQGRTLSELYGEDWVIDLFTKYAEFAEKAQQVMEKGEIAKDQKQVFDFDQRDDLRFREYLRQFNEPGKMAKVIESALVYCFANKLKEKTDREKLKDIALKLIKVQEPELFVKEEKPKNVSKRLNAEKANLLCADLPEKLKKLILEK